MCALHDNPVVLFHIMETLEANCVIDNITEYSLTFFYL